MPVPNPHEYGVRSDSFSGVGLDAFAITPHNSTNFTKFCRAIYVGTTGDVSIETYGGTIVFVGVPAGTILPVVCTRVNATGTTADDLVGLV